MNRQTSLVRAIRANQWVVSGETLSRGALDKVTTEVLRMFGRSLYEFYHYMKKPEALDAMVRFDESLVPYVSRLTGGEPTVFVGLHCANFDLVLRVAALRGFRPYVIGIADPGTGYLWQNAMRREVGFDIESATDASIKRAIRVIEGRWSVLTGIDRPMEQPAMRPVFFGRPSALPVMPARLGMKTGAPIIVFAPKRLEDGTYRLLAAEPIEMDTDGERDELILANAEKALRIAEAFILANPTQWAMQHAVWPETLEIAP